MAYTSVYLAWTSISRLKLAYSSIHENSKSAHTTGIRTGNLLHSARLLKLLSHKCLYFFCI